MKIVEKLPECLPTFAVDVLMYNDEGESANLKEWILNRLLAEVKSLSKVGEVDYEFLSAEALNPFCEGCVGNSEMEVNSTKSAVTVRSLDKSDDEKTNNLNCDFEKVSIKCVPNVEINDDLHSFEPNIPDTISSSDEISSSSGSSTDNNKFDDTISNSNSSSSKSSTIETNELKSVQIAQPISVEPSLQTNVPPQTQPVFHPNYHSAAAYPPPGYYSPAPHYPPHYPNMMRMRSPYNQYLGPVLQKSPVVHMYPPPPPNWTHPPLPPAGFAQWPQNVNNLPVLQSSQAVSATSWSTGNNTPSANNANAKLNVLSQEFVPVNGNLPNRNDLNPVRQEFVPKTGVVQRSESQIQKSASKCSNNSGTLALPEPAIGEPIYRPFNWTNVVYILNR